MGRTMNLKSAISSAEKILEQPTRCEEFAEMWHGEWSDSDFKNCCMWQQAAGKAEAAAAAVVAVAAAARDGANLQHQLKGSSTRSPKALRP